MRRVLVTGATRGPGRALANELNRRDHEVVATGRRLADMTDLPASEGSSWTHANPESIDDAMAAAGSSTRSSTRRQGAKGRRWYAWSRLALASAGAPEGWGRWLLVRRSLTAGELA
jgi:hypothetical protein